MSTRSSSARSSSSGGGAEEEEEEEEEVSVFVRFLAGIKNDWDDDVCRLHQNQKEVLLRVSSRKRLALLL